MLNMCRNDLALSVALVVLGVGVFVIGMPLLVADFPQDSKWEAIWVCVTAVFTVVLAVSTILLWSTTKAAGERADSAIRTIERAYVKMSHHPPGLNIETASGMCWLSLHVKNFGHTPARVTDAHLTVKILPNNEPLPGKPVYERNLINEVYKVFLVTNDDATYYPIPFNVGLERVPGLDIGTLKLWLIGHVDYTDMFDQRYRAGYARMYRSGADMRELYGKGEAGDEAYARRNNLVFVTEEGYNYDICLDDTD